MADVYKAIDTILNREVAVKILRGELSHDPMTLLRFQREASAASKLSHPTSSMSTMSAKARANITSSWNMSADGRSNS